MEARLRSWWQQIQKHRVTIVVGAIVCAVVIVIIIIGYQFDWTGFNGYNKVTTTHIVTGANAGTVTRTEEYQPGKGLWDWLQLLGLIAIPIVVGIGAAWFSARQNHDREIAADHQREAALQAYLDKMSELLIKEHLLKSKPGDEVRTVATVRTLTLLTQLDSLRRRSVLRFLQQADLINRGSPIVNLSTASLRFADLHRATLSDTDLSRSSLRNANLSRADLDGADLSEADLRDADLRGANPKGANLSKADLSNAIVTLEQLDW